MEKRIWVLPEKKDKRQGKTTWTEERKKKHNERMKEYLKTKKSKTDAEIKGGKSCRSYFTLSIVGQNCQKKEIKLMYGYK